MQIDFQKGRHKSRSNSLPYKLPMSLSALQQAFEKIGYAARPHHPYPGLKFRAKFGFPVKAGVLPIKPLRTSSAAMPLPPQDRPTPKAKQVDIQKAAPLQPADQPEASISLGLPGIDAQERSLQHTIACADSVSGNKSMSFFRPKRVKTNSLPMQSGIFAGLVTVISAIVFGAFWGLGNPSDTILVQATPSKTPSKNERGQMEQANKPIEAADAKDPQARMGARQSVSNETDLQSQVPQQVPALAMQSRPHPGAIIVSANEQRPESPKASTSTSSKKQVQPKEKRSTSQRASELNRLKAQAFAETRKDRVSAVKSSRRSFVSDSQSPQSIAKRNPVNADQFARQISMAGEFNQCKRQPSFFQQEKCKWRICAGRWGQNGCPAYNHDVARY